jgi:hypothetical protein
VTTAGFVGLGSQGAGMAQRIMAAGIPMTLWTRTSGSGRSFSLEVFVGVGSFEPIAGHLGPLLSKDVGLFGLESLPTGGAQRAALLTAADRLLALVDHPRRVDRGSVR